MEPQKKAIEAHYAMKAAQFLAVQWDLGLDREQPDFIVTEGASRFGLEVTEIFVGRMGHAGSVAKKLEAMRNRQINALQREFLNQTGIVTCVKFLGELSECNLSQVLPALLAENLQCGSPGCQRRIDLPDGLTIHVTRDSRGGWFSVNDRVGYVDLNPKARIASTVKQKAVHLPTYSANANSNVRLLIVANREQNSGKLKLARPSALDLHGFEKVYFLSYPESLIIFSDGSDVQKFSASD